MAKNSSNSGISQHKRLAMGQTVKMREGGQALKRGINKPDNTQYQNYGRGVRKVKGS